MKEEIQSKCCPIEIFAMAKLIFYLTWTKGGDWCELQRICICLINLAINYSYTVCM